MDGQGFQGAAGPMDSIEKAIRTAFAKGDPGDRVFREKVYRSAFGALDRTLKANPNMTEAIAQRRREALLAAITAIETEFVPARAAAVEPASTSRPEPAPARRPSPEIAVSPVEERAARREAEFSPTLDGERRSRPAAPATEAVADAPARREGRRARPRRKARLVGPLLFLLLLGAMGAGFWWAVTSGTLERLLTEAPRGGGANGGPRVPGNADTFAGWTEIFTADDPTTVTAPGDTRAEVMAQETEQFIRLSAGASGSPILFDVGQGVLEQMAGKRAVFNVVARTSQTDGTQISIECAFGALGDCGRKRYAVGATREEYLFEVDLPALRPDSGGTIAINPDVDGNGGTVDVYAIRVMPAS